MTDVLEKTNKNIESIALEIVMLDVQDIPALGKIVNYLGVLEEDSKEVDQPAFSELIQAIKGYIEKLILGEAVDAAPLEEGIDSLQTIFRCVINQEEYDKDISQILTRLEFKQTAPDEAQHAQAVGAKEKEEEIRPPPRQN